MDLSPPLFILLVPLTASSVCYNVSKQIFYDMLEIILFMFFVKWISIIAIEQ